MAPQPNPARRFGAVRRHTRDGCQKWKAGRETHGDPARPSGSQSVTLTRQRSHLSGARLNALGIGEVRQLGLGCVCGNIHLFRFHLAPVSSSAAPSSALLAAVTVAVCCEAPVETCPCLTKPPAPSAPPPATCTNTAARLGPHRAADFSNRWRGYRDPVLNRLIDRVLAQSPTLQQAIARVGAVGRIGAVPPCRGWGSVDLTRRLSGSSEGLNTGGEALGQGQKRAVGTFQAGFDSSWEIDLFGRMSNAIAGAQANADVAPEDAATARITLGCRDRADLR